MEWKLFLTVFASVLVAEMADKTQLVTMLFAADQTVSRLTVFIAASLALILASAIGVAAGAVLAEVLDPRWLPVLAGSGFIIIGAWTLYQGLNAA